VNDAPEKVFDLIVIGAGPAGMTAAFEAGKHGIDYLVLEKGLLANTVYQYPIGLTVFSTPDELEMEPGALSSMTGKPTREQLLSYYVRFVREKKLNIQTGEQVTRVWQQGDLFSVETDKTEYRCRKLIFAIGAMDHPRKLNVPGEGLSKVHHVFKETYPWVGKRAMVIGGGNSAGEAALFLAQEGVETTIAIFRSDWENADPKQGCIKYWVKEPLEQEREVGCLTVFFLNSVKEITESEIVLEAEDGSEKRFENDVVFVLIGSDADLRLMKSLGIKFGKSKYGEIPIYDPVNFQTEVKGIYTIGHFTEQRHISGAINAARSAVAHLAQSSGEGIR
jgi:thioredoxin reductase (NADPH)